MTEQAKQQAINSSAQLGDAFILKNGQVIANRLFKSAMSEQLGNKQHNPKPGLATLYGRWAEGGIGLSITGNIMVDRGALGEPKNVVLDGQSDLSEFKKWAEAGKKKWRPNLDAIKSSWQANPQFYC